MRSLLLAALLLGCGGTEPPRSRIENMSSEVPSPDLTTEESLMAYVGVVEAVADVALAQQDCATQGRAMLAVLAEQRAVVRIYHREQTFEEELAEMTEGDDLLHARKLVASRDIVDRWDVCADDPAWNAMYRILFLGE